MTLILLHGFCEDHNIWNHLLPFLNKNLDTHCIDLPGFGDNSDAYMQGGSVESMAEFVKKEIDKHTNEPVILIGHSLGGYVTLAFAEKYPGSLLGFGLFHSTATADNEDRKAARLKTIDFVKENGAEAFHRVLIPGLFKANTDAAVIEETIALARSARADGIIAALNAMRSRPARVSLLEQYDKPILFIAGENDALIPKQAIIDQAALCKTAQVEVLTGSAHMGQIEEPERSAEMINTFCGLILTTR